MRESGVFDARDHRFMARALQLARRGLYSAHPNPRVGCVLAAGEQTVAEAWHRRTGEAHAEAMALALAGDRAAGTTAYVTLEPCVHYGRTPPCVDALLGAAVARVVVAMVDPNPRVAGQGLARLRAAGVPVEVGLLASAARALNAGFLSRMRRGRPLVRGKMAMSLDGRTALASGESRWITGASARRDVHRLRARSGAVLTGAGTVLADDPALTVRLEREALPGLDADLPMPAPLRVVLDPRLRIPPHAAIFNQSGKVLVFTGLSPAAVGHRSYPAGVEVETAPIRAGALDLAVVLQRLACRGINEVVVEAGATLMGAFIRAQLMDELVLYAAPCLLGGDGRPLVAALGIERMSRRLDLEIVEVRAVGRDWRIRAIPKTTE